jgi:hypothetical protein
MSEYEHDITVLLLALRASLPTESLRGFQQLLEEGAASRFASPEFRSAVGFRARPQLTVIDGGKI